MQLFTKIGPNLQKLLCSRAFYFICNVKICEHSSRIKCGTAWHKYMPISMRTLFAYKCWHSYMPNNTRTVLAYYFGIQMSAKIRELCWHVNWHISECKIREHSSHRRWQLCGVNLNTRTQFAYFVRHITVRLVRILHGT